MIKSTYVGEYRIRYYGNDIGFSIKELVLDAEEIFHSQYVIESALLDGGFNKSLVEKIMDYACNFGRIIINYDDHTYKEIR